MLRLVSKKRFEDNCLGRQPNKQINLELENSTWPYYEIPEKGWVMYISELSTGLIFGEGDDDFSINYDDWKLTKISDKPDPLYILNIMKSCNYLDSEFYKVCDQGIWKLENDRISESLEFSIKVSGSRYYPTTAIGYPEKLKIPICKSETKIKDNFIQTICYGLRRNNI